MHESYSCSGRNLPSSVWYIILLAQDLPVRSSSIRLIILVDKSLTTVAYQKGSINSWICSHHRCFAGVTANADTTGA